jgi:MFS family permease
MAEPISPGNADTSERLPSGITRTSESTSPLREVLAIRTFRYFWISQFLSNVATGTIRFVFIWLALELSSWPAAASAIGFAAGLPALILALPAGVLSDRMSRWHLIVFGSVAASAMLLLTAGLVAAGMVGLNGVIALAGAVSLALAIFAPAQQAVVPSIVPVKRLTNAIALQTIAMQIAMFLGAIVGGGAIASIGVVGAFAILAGLMLLSAATMAFVEIPPHEAREVGTPPVPVLQDIRMGLTFVFRDPLLASLMLAGVIIGTTWGLMQINMPVIAKELLGQGAFTSALLVSASAPGMLLSSLYLASRHETRRQGLWFGISLGLGLGGGALLLGWSQSYSLSLIIMVIWGVFGGVAITMQRTILQSRTPLPMMGRVMGIWTLALLGSFPLAAVISGLLVEQFGPAGALMTMGAITMVTAPFVVLRRIVRTA